MTTAYHAKYFAYELTKQCAAGSVEKIAASFADAQVDLNPHQIEAALFAFRSPLSKGAILADEVGLGKTIEAGILLAQRWAERKRKLLIIVPANLRKQWSFHAFLRICHLWFSPRFRGMQTTTPVMNIAHNSPQRDAGQSEQGFLITQGRLVGTSPLVVIRRVTRPTSPTGQGQLRFSAAMTNCIC